MGPSVVACRGIVAGSLSPSSLSDADEEVCSYCKPAMAMPILETLFSRSRRQAARSSSLAVWNLMAVMLVQRLMQKSSSATLNCLKYSLINGSTASK